MKMSCEWSKKTTLSKHAERVFREHVAINDLAEDRELFRLQQSPGSTG